MRGFRSYTGASRRTGSGGRPSKRWTGWAWPDRAGHRPNQLSGGQQQRVAVARALIGSPSVILADEPTGALDPDTGREIMDMFERLSSEQQMAVVIVTHSPEVSERCRRRARVEDGLVREERADGAAAQQDGRSGGGRAFQG